MAESKLTPGDRITNPKTGRQAVVTYADHGEVRYARPDGTKPGGLSSQTLPESYVKGWPRR